MSSPPELEDGPPESEDVPVKAATKFNETMLTDAFDDCLKLVHKSVLMKNPNHKGGQARKEIPKKAKKDAPEPKVITHKSKIFRYSDEAQDTNSPIVMPPPPIDTGNLPLSENQDEARASMLMSWYMAGYHTGYYEAMRKFDK